MIMIDKVCDVLGHVKNSQAAACRVVCTSTNSTISRIVLKPTCSGADLNYLHKIGTCLHMTLKGLTGYVTFYLFQFLAKHYVLYRVYFDPFESKSDV